MRRCSWRSFCSSKYWYCSDFLSLDKIFQNETQAISAVKSEHQVTSTSELIKTETNANDDVTMRTGMKSEVSAKIESKPNITSSVDQSGTSSSRQNEATGDISVLDLDCEDMQVVSAGRLLMFFLRGK